MQESAEGNKRLSGSTRVFRSFAGRLPWRKNKPCPERVCSNWVKTSSEPPVKVIVMNSFDDKKGQLSGCPFLLALFVLKVEYFVAHTDVLCATMFISSFKN